LANKSILIAGFVILTSCKIYYISPQSFKDQFAKIDSFALKPVTVIGPYGVRSEYLANPVEKIMCTDEKGKPSELTNGPSIEVRFTYGYKSKRTVFYFDQICVHQNAVVGTQSRFMSFLTKSIPMDSITKVEVQNGHKDFRYDHK
jgi:hypothetical protein